MRNANARKGGQEAVALDEAHRKKQAQMAVGSKLRMPTPDEIAEMEQEDQDIALDNRDLAWSAVLKRTFESYIRGERPNMYGEWLKW